MEGLSEEVRDVTVSSDIAHLETHTLVVGDEDVLGFIHFDPQSTSLHPEI
jgi:hypothetical protein